MRDENKKILAVALFWVYIFLLTGVILFKLPFYSPEVSDGIRVVNLIPFKGSFDENGVLVVREIIQNIILFIPFGIYVGMFKSKWSFIKKALSVVSLTLAFEVTQFIFALGRSDITDIIDNTLGGIIGIGIYAALSKIFRKKTYKAVTIFALAATIYAALRFAYIFYLSHFSMTRPSL